MENGARDPVKNLMNGKLFSSTSSSCLSRTYPKITGEKILVEPCAGTLVQPQRGWPALDRNPSLVPVFEKVPKLGLRARFGFRTSGFRLTQNLRDNFQTTSTHFSHYHSLNSIPKVRRGSDRGAVLLIVIIVMLTVSILGATLVTLFFNVLTVGQNELHRAQALYLSEAGIAVAMKNLKGQKGQKVVLPENRIVPVTQLGEGTFEVFLDQAESTLVSVGVSHGVSRTIQLKYNAY